MNRLAFCYICGRSLGPLPKRRNGVLICLACADRARSLPPPSPAMADTWVRVMGGA